MDFALSSEQAEIKRSVEAICANYDLAYWAKCDGGEVFPEAFFQDMVKGGYTAITLPAEHGGSGLGIETAAVVMQTISESGAGMTGASTVHSYVFIPKAIALHGSEEQKARMLPPLISGAERACLGITEPDAGIDTTRLRYRAVRKGDHYVFTGEKVWPTMGSTADRVLLIARTTPIEECKRPIDGLSLFYTKIDRRYVEARKIPKMGRNAMESCQLHFSGLPIPVEDRIGEEGEGTTCGSSEGHAPERRSERSFRCAPHSAARLRRQARVRCWTRSPYPRPAPAHLGSPPTARRLSRAPPRSGRSHAAAGPTRSLRRPTKNH